MRNLLLTADRKVAIAAPYAIKGGARLGLGPSPAQRDDDDGGCSALLLEGYESITESYALLIHRQRQGLGRGRVRTPRTTSRVCVFV